MLDIHNHVLFGLDDGCRTLEESLALASLAKRAGHAGFIATPHIRAGMFDNTPELIRARRDEAKPHLSSAGLELHLGAEYYFDEHVLPAARKRSLLTLGETSRFVLIELPQLFLPPRFEHVLFELRIAGYVPVIAHPERCRALQDDVAGTLAKLEHGGVLLQLDLGSLIGHYGRGSRAAAIELARRGAYHVAACDLHRPEDVGAIVAPSVAELGAILDKRKKRSELDVLLDLNPRRILANAPLAEIPAV